MNCRFCSTPLSDVFVDLGHSPISNAFLTQAQLQEAEVTLPLKTFVCPSCFLVQTADYKPPQTLFDDTYVYFSSYSKSWLEHARAYVEDITSRFDLSPSSLVIEIASNDGYLLQYFLPKQIPVLGIEPTANTAQVALAKNIPTVIDFFGTNLANDLIRKGQSADLLLGNNVLAHVPDINDFVLGLKKLLKPNGVITLEFPHILNLIQLNQFDTIYHEHYSYLSLTTVRRILAAHGLAVFDAEQLSTHGGSLRIYAKHANDLTKPDSARLADILFTEKAAGIHSLPLYQGLQQRAFQVKLDLIDFLVHQNQAGKRVAAYGAAAKGNTLLNYCGIKSDLITFVADANPNKQDKFLPGSHIPVVSEDHIRQTRPNFILILPWNLTDEIKQQLQYVREWGCQFVTPIPKLTILD